MVLNMAMICEECGGIIPDIVYDGNRSDCKNHITDNIDIKIPRIDFK